MSTSVPTRAIIPLADLKGRGARTNRESRFDAQVHEVDGDYLDHASAEPEGAAPATTVTEERARSIISRNQSPDIGFDRSINPYRGCEHGCIYCYARPTHAYLGLSPGLDFETRLFAKTNAAELLDRELRKPGYSPALLALGANTDPYQPIERRLRITRAVLEILHAFKHPVGITTKSALVARDIDLLAEMAAENLAGVFVSIGTLDNDIARTLEPRANSPQRRLEAIRRLSQAGIPTGVIVAPLIPTLTDPDLEKVLEAAAAAGATMAGYTVLRLPLEVRDLFVEWLEAHHPMRAAHVMSLVRQLRGGRDNDPEFFSRMHGEGALGDLLRRRFDIACRRLGLDRQRRELDTTRFRVPTAPTAQLTLL
ncbi:MAG TPA: PA0069 family radical SAM protein [Burkholderiaceae bacterium]